MLTYNTNLILFQCENLNDAEQLTWLVINHVGDLIELVQESPVLDFVRYIIYYFVVILNETAKIIEFAHK